jgi:hypothetical protein
MHQWLFRIVTRSRNEPLQVSMRISTLSEPQEVPLRLDTTHVRPHHEDMSQLYV